MAEKKEDVKPKEAEPTADSSPVESEPEQPVSEDVKTPEPITAEQKYDNALKALREEREKRKEAERVLAEREQSQTNEQPYSDDAVYQDYLATKGSAFKGEIGYKIATDPSFKKRALEVADVLDEALKAGKQMTVDQADAIVKAKLFDKLTKMTSEEEKVEKPKQIKANAVPEEEKRDVSYADIKSGKDKSPEAEALRGILKTFS
ncbi:MAG: hypothetical protein FJ045_04785 [Crenarchaeota archaeon]|nr:hypothetical protein [Thermoproteota archaeon]